MSARSFIAIAFSVSVSTLMVAGPASAQTSSPRPDNYYAAGNRVEIAAPMPADVVVAGRDVMLKQPIAGDVLAAITPA